LAQCGTKKRSDYDGGNCDGREFRFHARAPIRNYDGMIAPDIRLCELCS
jgi:hypothetical protein